METNGKALAALILITSCGYYERPSKDHRGHPAPSCSVGKVGTVTTITCPDGTQQTVVDGEKGLQGVSGTIGTNGSTGPAGHDGVSGHDGVAGKDGLSGPQGAPGRDGAQGIQGTTGATGAVGATGASGIDGLNGTVITPVVPCPSNTSGFPEVLLCIDDSLYAVYDGNPNEVHYAKIPPGSYVTTDNRSCYFTVTTGCTLI